MIRLILRIIIIISTAWKKSTVRHLNVGRNSCVYPSAYISTRYNKWGGVKIGTGCRIGNFPSGYKIGWYRPTRISARSQDASIHIGDRSRISGANIYARSSIEIGPCAEIGSGVIITDFNGHITYSFDRTVGEDMPKPIIIGRNVWIGFNSIILKGSVIGDNSIVGAGSVVSGEFPPYSIIKGNPAKIVKIMDPNKFSK